jgi:hypothetical protein
LKSLEQFFFKLLVFTNAFQITELTENIIKFIIVFIVLIMALHDQWSLTTSIIWNEYLKTKLLDPLVYHGESHLATLTTSDIQSGYPADKMFDNLAGNTTSSVFSSYLGWIEVNFNFRKFRHFLGVSPNFYFFQSMILASLKKPRDLCLTAVNPVVSVTDNKVIHVNARSKIYHFIPLWFCSWQIFLVYA